MYIFICRDGKGVGWVIWISEKEANATAVEGGAPEEDRFVDSHEEYRCFGAHTGNFGLFC